jgi:hypothetical protein
MRRVGSAKLCCAFLVLAVALCATEVAFGQQTYNPPHQYYSPNWVHDGVSQNYGTRYKCFYYWKVANQNHYRRYEVYFYPNYPAYCHIYNQDAGHFLYRCTTHQHPNYDYWASQWSYGHLPSDPPDNDFDPNAPPTPGNSGMRIPRIPCPPPSGGTTVPPNPPIDPT